MPDSKRAAIQHFLNDAETTEAVRGVLVQTFLKAPKQRDVQSLAAAWMAKDLFDEAWKELARLKQEEGSVEKVVSNPGL